MGAGELPIPDQNLDAVSRGASSPPAEQVSPGKATKSV